MTQWRAGRFLPRLVLAALMLLPDCSAPRVAQAQTVTAENPWTNLWQQIVRRHDQEPPRTSRGLICPIVPQLIEQRGSKLTQVIFEILDQPARAQITAELTQLEARLRRQQATPEARVQQRVQLFLDKNLFLDAIQELYAVPQPSSTLKKLQQQIEQLSCPDSTQGNSSGGLR